jgi:hypothetical protein
VADAVDVGTDIFEDCDAARFSWDILRNLDINFRTG